MSDCNLPIEIDRPDQGTKLENDNGSGPTEQQNAGEASQEDGEVIVLDLTDDEEEVEVVYETKTAPAANNQSTALANDAGDPEIIKVPATEPGKFEPLLNYVLDRNQIQKSMVAHSQNGKPWHNTITPAFRDYVVHMLQRTMLHVQRMLDEREHFESYAKEIETELYERANSKDEYYLLVKKYKHISEIRRELDERSRRRKGHIPPNLTAGRTVPEVVQQLPDQSHTTDLSQERENLVQAMIAAGIQLMVAPNAPLPLTSNPKTMATVESDQGMPMPLPNQTVTNPMMNAMLSQTTYTPAALSAETVTGMAVDEPLHQLLPPSVADLSQTVSFPGQPADLSHRDVIYKTRVSTPYTTLDSQRIKRDPNPTEAAAADLYRSGLDNLNRSRKVVEVERYRQAKTILIQRASQSMAPSSATSNSTLTMLGVNAVDHMPVSVEMNRVGVDQLETQTQVHDVGKANLKKKIPYCHRAKQYCLRYCWKIDCCLCSPVRKYFADRKEVSRRQYAYQVAALLKEKFEEKFEDLKHASMHQRQLINDLKRKINNQEKILSEKTKDDPLECKICLSSKANKIWIPCGHICCCSECYEKMCRDIGTSSKDLSCPMCRAHGKVHHVYV